MSTRNIGIAVCLGGIALAAWLYFWLDNSGVTDERTKMLHELFKFSISTVVVGGAALFYGAFQRRNEEHHEQAVREREAKSARRQRLEDFLRECTDDYNDIKFVRRELRRALMPMGDDTFAIDEKNYIDLLAKLNRGQLKLEQYRRVVESKPAYLSFFGDDGIAWLSSAEDYLRKVTAEYEGRRLNRAEGEPAKLMVPRGSRLFQFVVSQQDPRHDGSSVTEHFEPLDSFFVKLSKNIEGLD